MDAKQVAELRERFARDGYVEFRLRWWKVGLHLALVTAFALVFLIWTVAWWPLLAVVPIILGLIVLPLLLVGSLTHLKGSGRPLRVDGDGVQLRGWKQPCELPWSDVVSVVATHDSKLTGPTAAFLVVPTALEEFMDSQPPLIRRFRWLARIGPPRVPVPKFFDVAGRDLLAWLDDPTLDGLMSGVEAQRLVLAPGVDGHGPLFFRNGREPVLAGLPLTEATRSALRDWNVRANAWMTDFNAVAEAERGKPSEGSQRSIDAHAAEGRTLATHVQSELGLGTEVTLWLDSPDF